MGISGQSVVDENGIAAVGVEGTDGFIPYIDLLELSAAIKIEGSGQAEIQGGGDQCLLLFDFSVSSCLVY